MFAAACAHVRQLCCLGLGEQAIGNDLLQAVEEVIPSGPNALFVVKRDGEPDFMLVQDCPETLWRLYGAEHRRAFAPAVGALMRFSVVQAPGAYFDYEDAVVPGFYGTEFYQQIWRPMGQHHSLRGLARDRGAVYVVLLLCRGMHERRFTRMEAGQLEQLLPYVAFALHRHADPAIDGHLCRSAQIGHVLVDSAGRLSHQCDAARTMLSLLTGTSSMQPHAAEALPALFADLAGRLHAIQQGQEAPPPVASLSYGGGRLTFRAYGLNSDVPEPQPMTLIAIEQEELEALVLMRGLRTLPLSAKEREVSLWLTLGLASSDVAARVGVKPNTAKAYADSAYTKLNVHSRAALREKIVAEAEINRAAMRRMTRR